MRKPIQYSIKAVRWLVILALLFVTLRSLYRVDQIEFCDRNYKAAQYGFFTIITSDGGLVLQLERVDILDPKDARKWADRLPFRRNPKISLGTYLYGNGKKPIYPYFNDMRMTQWMGFGWEAKDFVRPDRTSRDRQVNLVTPLLLYICLLIVPDGLMLLKMRRTKKRARMGLCPQCGYNLKMHATGDRCPECGTPVRPSKAINHEIQGNSKAT